MKLLPRPKELVETEGSFRAPPEMLLSVTGSELLAELIAVEWQDEHLNRPAPDVAIIDEPQFTFSTGVATPDAPTAAEAFRLRVTPDGIAAAASDYRGLLYAWQSLKQVMRLCGDTLPCLTIDDAPDLAWRVYHLDLKGTRRRLEALYDLLPTLAELRINAVLVEYEDYLQLERHPQIAVDAALAQADVSTWIRAAAEYGVDVIPLVQTLGHLQYVLARPEFTHLQERPGEPATACPLHPETWPLVRDFLDEVMALHPDAPFIHVGLDETHGIGTCDRCRAHLAGRPPMMLYVEWLNRVSDHVIAAGHRPMAWGDMVGANLTDEVVAAIRPGLRLVDWGYTETAPTDPGVRLEGSRVSRDWLHRPNAPIATQPLLRFNPGTRFIEDLPAAQLEILRQESGGPEWPRRMRVFPAVKRLADRGLTVWGVSGVRVSYHGPVLPKFATGQLNSITWANHCRAMGGEGVIGSSWSRGHSLAAMNAHPELDWYALASLADAAWGGLDYSELRDFDERFACQFFGLPDGSIGDLFFLSENTSVRVDHSHDNFLEHIAGQLATMADQVTRNHDRFDLFRQQINVFRLRFRAQFAILEVEYFYPLWERVPDAMRQRILADIKTISAEMQTAETRAATIYASTVIDADATEMAATQLAFLRRTLERTADGLE